MGQTTVGLTDEEKSAYRHTTKEELDRISSIKANYDALTLRMGQIHFESKAINTEREQVEEAFQKNRDDEVSRFKGSRC